MHVFPTPIAVLRDGPFLISRNRGRCMASALAADGMFARAGILLFHKRPPELAVAATQSFVFV
jgi:hypothetical protein